MKTNSSSPTFTEREFKRKLKFLSTIIIVSVATIATILWLMLTNFNSEKSYSINAPKIYRLAENQQWDSIKQKLSPIPSYYLNDSLHFFLGVSLYHLNLHDSASYSFSKVRRSYLHGKSYYYRGRIKEYQEQYDSAMYLYREAIHTHYFPDSTLLFAANLAYTQTQEYDSCILYFKHYFALDTSHQQSLNSNFKCGLCLEKKERYREALLYINRSLDIDSSNHILQYYAGKYHYIIGDTKEACISWQKSASQGNTLAIENINQFCSSDSLFTD